MLGSDEVVVFLSEGHQLLVVGLVELFKAGDLGEIYSV